MLCLRGLSMKVHMSISCLHRWVGYSTWLKLCTSVPMTLCLTGEITLFLERKDNLSRLIALNVPAFVLQKLASFGSDTSVWSKTDKDGVIFRIVVFIANFSSIAVGRIYLKESLTVIRLLCSILAPFRLSWGYWSLIYCYSC
jgi:hypothetical protein